MRSPAELSTEFRSLGLKVTPQRQLLFRLLHDNTSHPSAEALFDIASNQMPGISLRTVYQTLTDLALMGELQSFDFGNGAARFDPNTGAHHHLVCTACGEVADVYVDGADRLHLAGGSGTDGPDGFDGFVVASTDIVFRGRCANCCDDPSAAASRPAEATPPGGSHSPQFTDPALPTRRKP
ncbi:unannotated protein [freshwater metagenome]|uniref:Unannotated protein n=1 Tax=freshwater metagenome TaxID=449393 RepID=A0A6J7F362_9ZZZZ|nr:hypothetical protein [Actinomycetota bacterium]